VFSELRTALEDRDAKAKALAEQLSAIIRSETHTEPVQSLIGHIDIYAGVCLAMMKGPDPFTVKAKRVTPGAAQFL